MKRWVGLFLVLAIAAVAVVVSSRRQRILIHERQRFEQVRVGMTSAESIAIMGEPTDKWSYFLEDGALVWVSAADTTVYHVVRVSKDGVILAKFTSDRSMEYDPRLLSGSDISRLPLVQMQQ
jgi:hypothetical protein